MLLNGKVIIEVNGKASKGIVISMTEFYRRSEGNIHWKTAELGACDLN